jgi:hypothetical protein
VKPRPVIAAALLAWLAACGAIVGAPALAPDSAPSAENKRGRELALKHCTACHLFPEPSLLPKTVWAHHVLPEMAKWLGLEPVNYEGMPDGKILQEANLYPTAPALTDEEWFAIWNYYVGAAPSVPLPPPAKPRLQTGLRNFRARKLNFHAGIPSISLVKIDPARRQLYVGDQFAGLLGAVDATGHVLSRVRLGSAPVSLAFTARGLYATLLGRLYPTDALEGSVALLPRDGTNAPQPLLEKLRRPTHTAVADLNGDGRDDLLVCSYGNKLGRFSWFEARPDGTFTEHLLLDRPGAVRAEVHDFDRDGRPDLAVLMAQAREGLYLFMNEGQGRFRMEIVVEQPSAFGYTCFELVDFNRDGAPDLLAVNGDNGDFPAPHRAYHGLRLHLNDGRNHFTEAWFHPLEGAYGARALDFDGDGDLDIAAIAYFPDFAQTPLESFVLLENKGGLKFDAFTLPEAAAGRWITMDAGDLDGDGDADIALGSFIAGPTTIAVPASVRDGWKTNGAAVLLLENLRRP